MKQYLPDKLHTNVCKLQLHKELMAFMNSCARPAQDQARQNPCRATWLMEGWLKEAHQKQEEPPGKLVNPCLSSLQVEERLPHYRSGI